MAAAAAIPAAVKSKKRTAEELQLLNSDVASFVSSLGIGGGGGFDDSDFRKTGPLKTPKYRANSAPSENTKKSKEFGKLPKTLLKTKIHPLQLNSFHVPDDRSSNLPKFPLMKATSLSRFWYDDAEELECRLLGEDAKIMSMIGPEELKSLKAKKDLGETLLGQYTSEYGLAKKKNGDMRLLETTARSGTSADKVSVFTCLVEDNPMANMRALDALLAMVTSKVGKRFAFSGYDALKELFLLRLLPNRKLKNLIQRPILKMPENKDGYSLLLFWYWEECLKQRYEKFVISLEEAMKDSLPNLKDKAMKIVYALLKCKPEQERKLLSSLVNKLGDPNRKSASNAGYELTCLLSEHPNMKAVVIDEVDRFLFRPHIGLRSKYYAVNFLSHFFLSKKGDGPKIAKRLVDVYFALFKVLMFEATNGEMHAKKKNVENNRKSGNKGGNNKEKTINSVKSNKQGASQETHAEMDSRLLSALLIGVNRAFPYVSSEEADDILEVQTPIIYKLVHSENFNVGVQALMLLYQITTKNQIASDRFYRALYAKLLNPAAVSSSKPEMFLGLVAKAMKNDINLKRISAFSKRLMQVALQRPPQYACGCLFLLSEVLKQKPALWRVVLQKESIDDEIEHFEDIVEEDQGILPSEKNSKLTSSAAQNGKILDFMVSKEDSNSDKEDKLNNDPRAEGNSGGTGMKVQSFQGGSLLPGGYDPRLREPVYCNAERTGLWELTILASHLHPSVSTMAGTLLSGFHIVYNGDPLNDLSLGSFLDKFMEKKARPNKAERVWHGGSQIAPARKLDPTHHLIGEEILQLAEEDVPPEDVVFHRFYMNRTTSSKKSKAKKKALGNDDDGDLLFDGEDQSEEDEDEVDDMLGAGALPLEDEEEGFDYDDLGRVIEEDDEDLLGHNSDAETEPTSDPSANDNQVSDSDHGDVEIWGSDIDDDEDDEDDEDDDVDGNENSSHTGRKKAKAKAEKKSKPSPFANLEDFEHLISEDRSRKMAGHEGKKEKSGAGKKRKNIGKEKKAEMKRKRKASDWDAIS